MTKLLTYVEIDIPDWIRTQVLLNFNDTNCPPLIIDEGMPRTWTLTGNAFIDQSDKKFGAGSLKLDGTGDASVTVDSPTIDLDTEDFTIDLWFKCTAAGGTNQFLAGQLDAAGASSTLSAWYAARNTSNNIVFALTQGSSSIGIAGTTAFTNAVNTGWHHAAFVRTGNILKLFIDGVQEGSDLAFTGAVNNSAANLGVGSAGGLTTNMWTGSLDAFRMSIGRARWTANFSVPTVEEDNLTTYRFAVDTSYLPLSPSAIPSIKEVKITPAIVSLGENIGQRASVEITFKDHRHIFLDEAFDSGTFWGKFRARYGLTLAGYILRLIRGTPDQIAAYVQGLGHESGLDERHYVIHSTDGPNTKGEFKIIAKDVLKLADGDRSQAPILSNGFLSAGITNVSASLTLQPAGIGDLEYPASGWVNIGGKEICSYTRSADVLTITRAQFNTAAVAHDAGERVQQCLNYVTLDVALIIYDLLVTYADVDSTWIPFAAWTTETSTYLSTNYSALIAEPTSVAKLISELIEQAGLAIWWNDASEQINLQVLRPVASDAAVYNADIYLADSLEIKEQPDKRLSQVYTYFAKVNPLINDDQINNYRSTAYATNPSAESEYGGVAAIKKIYSRWIPFGGRAIADTLNTILLARFRDPPRRISFNVLRDAGINPAIGVGYQIEGWPLQNVDGSPAIVPAQITRLNPRADIFEVEAEEISTESFATGLSPDLHTVIIDSNSYNVNMRTMHDSIYGAPISGQTVHCIVSAGIFVASVTAGLVAFDTGTWPAGVTIKLTVQGRIQGTGGKGGTGRSLYLAAGTGTNGEQGGTALLVRQAMTLTDTAGQIWGGGGGGGGCSTPAGIFSGVGCGGGGAGNVIGQHGDGDSTVTHGSNGTTEAGGAGGAAPSGFNGGQGGNPGLTGGNGVSGPGNAGGAPGNSISGIGFVTTVGGAGDRRGPQV